MAASLVKIHSFLLIFLFLATTLRGQAPALTPGQDVGSNSVQEPTPQQPGQLPPAVQPGVPAAGKTAAGEDKRILGVLPNYRTAEMFAQAHPLTPGQKMHIAIKDSFDYPLFLLAGAYAGLYQLEDSHPQFGQGAKGYLRRLGTSYTDQISGNMLTEGVLPILLKEDPRYFRMAEGSSGSRTWYAVSRIFVTRTDSGHESINYSELVGNAMAAGIGLSYYSDNRNVPDYLQNWGTQLGTDAVSQILKEFWPDMKRWWFARHPRKNVQADH